MLIFVVFLVLDLMVNPQINGLYFIQFASRVICGLVMVYFLIHEVKQIKRTRIQEYKKNYWNWFDVLLMVIYLTYVPFAYMQDSMIYIIKAIQCIIVLLTFIKITFFLRIFDEFSFLVQMMSSVFIDLRYFLMFFALFITTFGVFLSILIDD